MNIIKYKSLTWPLLKKTTIYVAYTLNLHVSLYIQVLTSALCSTMIYFKSLKLRILTIYKRYFKMYINIHSIGRIIIFYKSLYNLWKLNVIWSCTFMIKCIWWKIQRKNTEYTRQYYRLLEFFSLCNLRSILIYKYY